MRKLVLMSAAAVFFPSVLWAADNPPSQISPTASPPAAGGHMVCRSILRDAFARTECRTQQDWDAMRLRQQQRVREVQARAQQSQIHMGMARGH
jgi:hypothetical protein